MKTIRCIYILWMLAVLLPINIFAQDGRQRDYQTIVVDGLAQLPISDSDKRNLVMAELTSTGIPGVEMMAKMLAPAAEGKNAVVEYAISGVTNYVTAFGNKAQRESIRKGLSNSIAFCTDNTNRAFLLSQLQLCALPEDAPIFSKYLKDAYLADFAIRGLVTITGSDKIILNLMKEEAAPRNVLAHAAYKCQLEAAEPILLEWLTDADKETKKAIIKALSVCGTTVSLKTLSAFAKEEAYKWNKEKEATASYLKLLSRLAVTDEGAQAVKAAKKLLKGSEPYLRGAALNVVLSAESKAGMSYVRTALKDKSIEVRNNALRATSAFANDKVYATVASWMSSLSEDAQTDIIRWFGNRHATSQINAVTKAMHSSNPTLAVAGIESAGRIGGQKALVELTAQLDGQYTQEASEALLAFNGDIKEGVKTALDGNSATQTAALKLCAKRRINDVSGQVFSLLQSTNKEVKNAAYSALPNIVTYDDFDRLVGLLEKSDSRHAVQLQSALISALKSQTAQEQYKTVASYMAKSSSPVLYYPILAQSNTTEAINLLNKELTTTNENTAFKAMLTIDNPKMIDVLYKIAAEKPALKEPALARYTSLVSKSPLPGVRKYQHYQKALELKPSVKVQKQLLKSLSDIRRYPALVLAAQYLDQKETSAEAAAAVKTIVAKSDERLGGDAVETALKKAQAVYKTLPGADAGYAVDEITNLLSKLHSAPVFTLSEEEKKAGYEILFDGSSLDKWTGNKDSYVIENGNIYVSAGYGSGGNLYTEKEYSDFVLRFEFCFDREGVNNGIGVRTQHGTDAAYHGMEIQILDHDAPIYKGLHEWQQHGSVYGIIPAKRIKFGKLGTWNVEELRVVGDQVTVTVNGEVILDGNIRKACQGHNVAKDGSKKNPYTVDHKNHPGLFNKKGYIALCGHGAGIRFRNVRVLDLGSKSGL